MPRLFFALSLPEAVSDALDPLCEGIPRARWALENDFHITLSFLGDIPSYRMEEVMDVAHSLRGASFDLELQSAGVFPHRGQPRVLWVGVRKEERLLALQKSLHGELRRADFDVERRKYHPHVTLARIDRCRPGALSDWLSQHLGFATLPFRVRRFHLFSSVLGRYGAEYTLEKSFFLRA